MAKARQNPTARFDELEARFYAAQEARNAAEVVFWTLRADAPESLETAKSHVRFAQLEAVYIKAHNALDTLCWEILAGPADAALLRRATTFLEPGAVDYGVDVYQMAFESLAGDRP
jgi:hypothetical protein